MSNRHPSPVALTDALDDEWQRLSTSSAVVALINELRVIDHPVATLDELLAATGYRWITSGEEATVSDEVEADVVLGRLVRHAGNDQLAGRIVLQRILPGLRAAGRAWWRGCRSAGVEAHEVLDELISVSWEVISSYDVDRRPRHIASNLIRATADRAFVRPTRRRSATEQRDEPAHFDRWCATRQESSSDELVGVLSQAMEHRDVDAGAVGLLRDLVNADGSTRVVAERHRVTARTVRTRRKQAITHIRRLITDHAA